MKRKNFGKALMVRAEECSQRTGVPVRVVVDNSPINHCFFTAEARKLGYTVNEPSFQEITYEAVVASSKRMNGG